MSESPPPRKPLRPKEPKSLAHIAALNIMFRNAPRPLSPSSRNAAAANSPASYGANRLEENWFPWMKAELEKKGHQVIIPDFPTPSGQKIANWFAVFDEQAIPEISRAQAQNQPVILVGHSVGATFLLSVLERWPALEPAHATFLVAGFTGTLGIPEID